MQRRSIGTSARPTLRVKGGAGEGEDETTDTALPSRVLSDAIRRSPGEVSLVRDLAKLLVRDGEPLEAIGLLTNLLDIAKDSETLKSVHMELALIWEQGLGNLEQAILHLRQALELAPRDGDVLRTLSALLAQSAPTGAGRKVARNSTAKAHNSNGAGPQTTAATKFTPRATKGVVIREEQISAPVPESPRGKANKPQPSGLHSKSVSQADCAELQKRALARPEDVHAWRELCHAYAQAGQHDLSFRSAQLVAVLDDGAAHDTPISRYAVHPASAARGSFTPSLLDEVGTGLSVFGVAGELLSVLEPWIAELKPMDLASYGTLPRAKLTHESPHAMRKLADTVASIVKAGPFDLYLHRARSRGAGLELGSPPAILIPARLEHESQARQVYELARLLTARARGIPCVMRLEPDELQACLRGFVSSVVPDFVPRKSHGGTWFEGAQRYRAKNASEWNKAREVAQRYAASPVAVAAWCEDQKRAATRAAALLADDLRDAYESAPDPESKLDLLRFWVSPCAIKARARMGIA